jgi:hypothetical protein
MQHVQGYTGSHWTLPSGDYSLRIALAAARTAKQTTMYYVPTLMAISVVIAMRRYYCAHRPMMEEVQGFHMPLNTAIG